jgi:hypothetical protein
VPEAHSPSSDALSKTWMPASTVPLAVQQPPTAAVTKTVAAPRHRRSRWNLLNMLGVLGCLSLVISLLAVIIVQFDRGEVVIQVPDGLEKSITVQLLRDGILDDNWEIKTGPNQRSIRSGPVQITLPDDVAKEFEFTGSNELIIKRNGSVTLTLTRRALPLEEKTVESSSAPKWGLNFDVDLAGTTLKGFPRIELPEPMKFDGPLTVEMYLTLHDVERNRNQLLFGATGILDLRTWKHELKWCGARNEGDVPYAHAARVMRPGVRRHVAGVSTGKQVRLFLDGTLVKEAPLPTPLPTDPPADGRTYIGGFPWRGGGWLPLNGVIDEVRVSTAALYDQQFIPPRSLTAERDTYLLYDLSDGQGEIAADSSGNGRHGKIVGAKWVKQGAVSSLVFHPAQPTLRFERVSSYAELPLSLRDADDPVTVEAWVLNEDKEVRVHLKTDENAWLFMRHPGGKFYWLPIGRNDRAPGILGSKQLAPGTWSHIAAVAEGNRLNPRIFIDGQPLDAKPHLRVLPNSGTHPSSVGYSPPTDYDGTHFPAGTVGALRISRSARYREAFSPAVDLKADDDTLALYRFDDGAGDKLTDSSGNGHHGKIIGAKWVRLDGSAEGSSLKRPTTDVALHKLPEGGYEVVAQNYRLRLRPTGLIEKVEAGETKLIEGTSFGRMGESNNPIKATQTGATLTFAEGDDYRLVYDFGPRGFAIKSRVSTAAAQRDGLDNKSYYLIHLTRFTTSAQRVRPFDGLPAFDLPATSDESYTNRFVVDFKEGAQVEVTSAKAEHSAFVFPGGPYAWGRPNLPLDQDNEIRFDIRAKHTEEAPEQRRLTIDEPPPLDEWLKGRTILTVAQDGSGQFTTIQAALDALKNGEVVKVLDRGPYQETLLLKRPLQDIGLISNRQTVIELAGWQPLATENPAKNKLYGHQFIETGSFRLSGFAFRYEHNPDAGYGYSVYFHLPAGLVVENCAFTRMGGPVKGTPAFGVHGWGFNAAAPIVLRECLFDSGGASLTALSPATAATPAPLYLVRRNYFHGRSVRLALDGNYVEAYVEHNLQSSNGLDDCGLMISNLGPESRVIIRNNTFHDVAGDHVRVPIPLTSQVEILNNILLRPLGTSDRHGAPAEFDWSRWKVARNAYARAHRPGHKNAVFTTADLAGRPEFLSTDPADVQFLRIPAEGPLSKPMESDGGPNYVGALPPGPAPADGDWFTRLRERWIQRQTE